VTHLDPEENRLYEKASHLHPLHWEALARRDPAEAARAAAASWDGRRFRLPFLGAVLLVEPGTRAVIFEAAPAHPVLRVMQPIQGLAEPDREPGYQRALVAVAYLAGAVDAPPRGVWAALRELPGGDAFFRGPHSPATPRLVEAFGRRPEGLAEAAARLGGRSVAAGDAAADLDALPRIPLRFVLWAGTDEFPPAATVLADARAHLHLPLDVLWALSNVAIADLTRGAAPAGRTRGSPEAAAAGSKTIPPKTEQCTAPCSAARDEERPQGSCGPGGDPSPARPGQKGAA
jgi:hypothetical protein